MASNRNHLGHNPIPVLLKHQKLMLQRHYSFINCKDVRNDTLTCSGTIENNDYKSSYKFDINYQVGKRPTVYIREPEIIPSPKIHMYSDKELCLFFPPDLKWTVHTEIYKYTIPWIVEWIHYYEIYLINGGIWEGPESPFHIS